MPQTTAPVQDMGQTIMGSLGPALGTFLGAIPKLFGFVIILIVGWLIAAAIAGVVAGVLRGLRFNDLAQRSGFSDFVRNMGIRTDASGFVAGIARWFVRLITLMVAGLVANALAGVVRGATASTELGNPDLLAGIARGAVLAFGVLAAINQLGVAQQLVGTLFMGGVGALALA